MLYPQEWVSLPQETKNRLRIIFNVGRTGSTEVVNGTEGSQVITDGTTESDLRVISVESMQQYLGVKETDFHALFSRLLNSFKEPIVLKVETIEVFEPKDVILDKPGDSEPAEKIKEVKKEVKQEKKAKK